MRLGALLVLCVALTGCAGLTSARVEPRFEARHRYEPPPGKQLLIVGQESGAARNERLWLGPAGAFMHYSRLGPILNDASEGPHELGQAMLGLQKRLGHLPHSAIQLGLYVVGHLAAIATGELDGNIDRLLEILKGTGRPVYLRFGYEVEGAWNHHDPAQFRKAWRHFHQRLLDAGARNVVMVWHAAADCSGTYQKHPLQDWYPGDDVVDWIGISWYTPADCEYRWPRAVLNFARERGKPLMVAESAPKGYDLSSLTFSRDGRQFEPRSADRIWEEWFEPFLSFVTDNADVVKAVSYVNDHWDMLPMWGPPYAHGYWGDSRIQASPEILTRWHAVMREPRWLRGEPETLKMLSEARR